MKRFYSVVALCGFFSLTGLGQNASAATKIFGYDFETGTLENNFNLYPGGGQVSISTAKAHSGTHSMFYNPTGGGDSTNPPALNLPNMQSVYATWWWWIPSTLGYSGAGWHTFRFSKRSGNDFNGGGQLDTGFGSSSGQSFDIDVLTPGADSLGKYHSLFNSPTNQWFKFEILSILNTGGLNNGTLKIWINGAIVANFTNVFYRPNGSSFVYDTFRAVTNLYGATSASYWYIDDLEIWDGIPGGGVDLPPPAPNQRPPQ